MAKKKKTKKKKSKKSTRKDNKHKLQLPSIFQLSFWLPSLFFFVFAFALYYQCLDYDFILDDKIVITHNNFTKKGIEGIPEQLSSDVFTGYFGEKKDLLIGGRYRPLSLVCFSIIYEIWELNPVPYHSLNIIVYALIACFVYYLLLALLPGRYIQNKWYFTVPLVASLLYLFHPIHIEAVANIKGLDELLTMFFALFTWGISLLIYNRKSFLWPVLSALTFFLALLAKENAITFLAVIPLSFYVFAQPDRKDYVRIITPLLISTAAYLFLRYQILGYFLNPGGEMSDIMNNPFYGLDSIEHFSTVMFTWLKYLILMIWPHPLVHDYYPYAIPIMELGDWRVILSVLIHLVLILTALIGSYRRKTSAFWVLYYFITFSIVSNMLFTVGTFMNERFIFMPSLAYAVLLSMLLVYYVQKWIPKEKYGFWISMALVVSILSAYSVKTFDRLPDWSTHLSLNKSAVDEYPTSARSTLFYATALFKEAMAETDRKVKLELLREAETWLDKSISIFPEFGNRNTRDYKYFNAYKMKAGVAAEIYNITGDLDYLLEQFLFVGKGKPNVNYLSEFLKFLNSRVNQRDKMIEFYHDLGYEALAKEQNKLNYGMAFINIGLEYAPNSALLNYDKGRIFQAAGRQGQAQKFIDKARSLDPSIMN